MISPAGETIARELSALCGPGALVEDPRRPDYLHDATEYQRLRGDAAAVVLPASEDALAAADGAHTMSRSTSASATGSRRACGATRATPTCTRRSCWTPATGTRSRAPRRRQDLFDLALRLGVTVGGEHGLGSVKRGQPERQWSPAPLEMHPGNQARLSTRRG